MPVPPFPQTREADLLSWSTSFDNSITADPTQYGLTEAQATAYHTLHVAFASAYATATNPNSNSKTNVEIKNTAKQDLLYGKGGAWELVNICQAFPAMNNDLRATLNIRIPDTDPTPVPVPDEAPVVDVVSTYGTTIKVRVHEATETPNVVTRKPPGVKGASLFWYPGANPPADINMYHFAGNTTKNVYDIVLPTGIAPGTKVWITAFWFNNRMESGPATQPPASVYVPGVLEQAA